jgi:hypothetical protein
MPCNRTYAPMLSPGTRQRPIFDDEAGRISSAAKPSNSSERMPPGRLHHARSTNREAPLTSADTEPQPTFLPDGTKPYPSLAGFAL